MLDLHHQVILILTLIEILLNNNQSTDLAGEGSFFPKTTSTQQFWIFSSICVMSTKAYTMLFLCSKLQRKNEMLELAHKLIYYCKINKLWKIAASSFFSSSTWSPERPLNFIITYYFHIQNRYLYHEGNKTVVLLPVCVGRRPS